MQRQHSMLLLLAAAAIAVLAGGWYSEARQRRQDATAFEARLTRLEHARSPADDVDVPARGPVARGVSVDALAGVLPPRPVPGLRARTVEDTQRQAAEGKARLEARFASDGSDAAWAMATESAVGRAIAEPALAPFKAPQASDIHCARTMCRLVFTFASLDQAEDWLTYYPLGVSGELPMFRSQSLLLPDGRVQLSMFGFRDARTRL